MSGKIPKPYVHDVKRDDELMIYTNIEHMDIGARNSGKPKTASTGPKGLDHVGGSAGKGK